MIEVLIDVCKIALIFFVVFVPLFLLVWWNGPRYRREILESRRIARRKCDIEEAIRESVDD